MIWVEQGEANCPLRERFGVKSALDRQEAAELPDFHVVGKFPISAFIIWIFIVVLHNIPHTALASCDASRSDEKRF